MIHDKPDPKRWNWNVKCDFESSAKRLSKNAGNTSNNRICDAVDRDIWLMKTMHGERGASFLKEWSLS